MLPRRPSQRHLTDADAPKAALSGNPSMPALHDLDRSDRSLNQQSPTLIRSPSGRCFQRTPSQSVIEGSFQDELFLQSMEYLFPVVAQEPIKEVNQLDVHQKTKQWKQRLSQTDILPETRLKGEKSAPHRSNVFLTRK